MSALDKEKEKLKKRLRTLFQKAEILKDPSNGVSNKNTKQHKEIKPANEKLNELNKDNSKNTKQKPFSQNKQKQSTDSLKVNEVVNTSSKGNVSTKKSEISGHVIHNDKNTEAKLQKSKNTQPININGNQSKEQQPNSNVTKKGKGSKMDKKVKKLAATQTHKNKKKQETKITNNGNQAQQNNSKSCQATILKDTHTKIVKDKKAKKRATSSELSNTESSKKKQKLSKEISKANKTSLRSTQKRHTIIYTETETENDFNLKQCEDEYDLNNMTGFVHGGDFDNDSSSTSLENDYCMEETQPNLVSLEKYQTDTEQEYFENDDEDQDYDDYFNDSCEEDEDDFYENGYEEEEDRYSWDTEDEEYRDYLAYNEEESDDDDNYELPEHVPEDLIIHKGTAIKRNLQPSDNISFNNEDKKGQVVEIDSEHIVKVIEQPTAYHKENLLKLNLESIALKVIDNDKPSCDSEDCPQLVPIVDEDGFQLYKPNEEDNSQEESYDSMDEVSLGSEYIQVNSDDEETIASEDINEKYLNGSNNDCNSDSSIDEDVWNKEHSVEVIDARDCIYTNRVDNSNEISNTSSNDEITQILSHKLYKNVDLGTKSCIISASIVDDEICKPERIISTKANDAIQEESLENCESEHPQNISTSQGDQSIEELQLEKHISSQMPKVIKSKTKFFNAFNSNLVIVLLKDPFCIYGTVRLTLLAGSVEVYGHTLLVNSEVELFSPRGCSVIEISPSIPKNAISKEILKESLKAYEAKFALADLKTIVGLYDCETDAVVLLKRNESRKKVVQQFKKFMNENVFPNNINEDRFLYNSEYLLRCIINTSALEQKCLRLPKQWEQLPLTTKSCVMLTGGKGVGKSTLLRYLINRHLPQKILLIDLDIGQPEVFIPQTISSITIQQPLLGPGFFLNLQPEISYAVGHTNITLCAHKYLAAVRRLIADCKAQDEYKEIPWLINTMGYNKGFGLELISIIAEELPLTDVVQLQSNSDINNFDSILYPHVLNNVTRIMFPKECNDEDDHLKDKLNYRLHVWQSAVEQKSRYQKDWEMSAKDMRFAMFLSRLSEALKGHAEWLTDVKPFSASLNDLKFVNIMDNTPSVSRQQLIHAVEANLVYLCQYEGESEPLKCLGIGIVRSIDEHIQQLYLIPAFAHTLLKNLNCLAIGEFAIPTTIFTNQGPRVKNTAPFVYNTVAANASKAIKQIYHRPRKFLIGKHKSLG